MNRRQFDIGGLAWVVLTVIGWGADLSMHQALVGPWVHALFFGGVQPTAWAVLRALPVGTWAIAMMAVGPASIIGWVGSLTSENEDEHRRGSRLTHADDLRQMINQKRGK